MGGYGILLVFLLLIVYNDKFTIVTDYAFLYGAQGQFPSISLNWIVIKFMYFFAIVVVSMAIMTVCPKNEIPILTGVGRKTMQVYFWHIPIRSIVFATGVQDIFATPIGKVFWTALSIVLTVILSTKPFGFPTLFILKGRRK